MAAKAVAARAKAMGDERLMGDIIAENGDRQGAESPDWPSVPPRSAPEGWGREKRDSPSSLDVYSRGMRMGFLLAILAYAAVLWAVAAFGLRRKPEGLEGFFLASRRLGAGRLAFTLCASWIGAASLLVSTDEAFRSGASAVWIVGVPAVVTLLALAALVRPIRAATGLTLSGLIRDRYGRAAGAATTVLIVWYMVLLAASQMVAAGPFLGAFLGTGPIISLLIAAGLVVVYSAAGGLQAVARTHVVQFALLVAGVIGMVLSLVSRVSWADVRAAAAASGKSNYFNALAGADRGVLIALSFALAWTISPIAWQRLQAAKSEAASRRGALAAALLLSGFYAAIVAAGMLFLPLFPGGGTGVPLVTRFVGLESGRFLGGLVFVTVLAAILSTMDAALNTGAFTLTRDLLGRGGRSAAASAERHPLVLARASTAVLAAAALLAAARLGDILKTLGLASAIMAEGLLVPGLAALFLKKRAPLAGLLSLLAGGGYALAGFLADAGFLRLSLPPWPRSLPQGLVLGAGGFLAGLLLARLRPRRVRPGTPAA
jgi:SSS family solute:Na+ symporter